MPLSRLLGDSRLGLSLFVLVHLSLPVGLWLGVRIGRPRFIGLALYLVAAVLLLDLLFFLGRPATDTAAHAALDVRLPITLLLVSAGVMALFGPGLLFYLGATGSLVLVLIRVFVREDRSSLEWVDLGVVSGTSILLIASQVFTVAYYVRVPDTVNHTAATMVLLDGQWLSAISSSRYFSYSAFHVLASTGMRFTQLEPRVFMSVLMIGLSQIALTAGFLFFRNWGRSSSLALIATILMGVNTAFVHYGTVPHYQTLSFVFFCTFLFLFTRRQWAVRDVTLAALIITIWVVTHHVSLLMAISLLALPVGYLVVRMWRQRREPNDGSSVLMFSILCLMFSIYWAIVTTTFREVVVWTFFTSSAAEGLPSDLYLVQTYDSMAELFAESLPFFVDSLHYSFLLALACIGIFILAVTNRLQNPRWRLVLLGFIPAAVLYFPNPVWIPLEGLIPFQRWRLMVLPFLVLIPALGFRYGMRFADDSTIRRIGVIVFTGALVFTMLTSGMAHPNLTELVGIQKGSQDYISDEELSATEFVYAHMTEQQRVYARSELTVYLHEYSRAQEMPYAMDQFADIRVSQTNRRLLAEPGLTVVSVDAFRNEGIYVQLTDLPSERYGDAELGSSVHASSYRWERTNASVVYSNGAVVVQSR